MLAALLTNLPTTFGHGSIRYRRPGEKFTTQDEWLRAQEELTKLKAKPVEEQTKVAQRAVATVKDSVSDIEAVKEAQDYILESGPDIQAILADLGRLEVVLNAYYVLMLQQRDEKDTVAMLALGIL